MTTKPGNRHMTKDIRLTAGDYMIDQWDKIKILGLYYTNGLENGPNISKIIQKVNYRVGILSKITRYTNIKTATILYNSLIISIFNYCIGCFLNNSTHQNSKLNTLINKCSHKILGIKSYCKSSSHNLKSLGWVSYNQMQIIGCTKLFHKVIFNSKPLAYTQYVKQSMITIEGSRKVQQTHIKRGSKTMKTDISMFYRGTRIYNTLPFTLGILYPKTFNKKIKE